MGNGCSNKPNAIIKLTEAFIKQPATISPVNSKKQTYQYKPTNKRMQRQNKKIHSNKDKLITRADDWLAKTF